MATNTLEQIDALNPWFYDLTIGNAKVTPGIGSPHSSEQLIVDTQYKRGILVDEIAAKYDFRNKSILDIASNCGYWSSYYAQYGATSLLAVEGRQLFIDQGRLYWEKKRFIKDNKYQFLLGDVTKGATWRVIEDKAPFDFVLCCGILYHIKDHYALLERIASVANEAVLVDTRVSAEGAHDTAPFVENGNWQFDGIDRTDGQKAVAAHPTLDFLLKFFDSHGYFVERIRSTLPVHKLMYEKDNYDLNKRVTLLCRKKC